MSVTQEDLLEWTKEYASLRKLNPLHLHLDFNDWIKHKILEKEALFNNNAINNEQRHFQHATPLPIPTHAYLPPVHQVKEEGIPVIISHTAVHLPSSTSSSIPSPLPASHPPHLHSPSLRSSPPIHSHSPSPASPSSSPSPSIKPPKKQSHLTPHPHSSTPILHHVPSPLRASSPSNISSPPLSSLPSSSSETMSPIYAPARSKNINLHNNNNINKQMLLKEKSTPKRRYSSPPRGSALIRSLSQSLIPSVRRPSPQHQLSHVAFDPLPPHSFSFHNDDMGELREYLNQFQTKQQNQLFKIFDIVENINNKLSGQPPSPTRSISSSSSFYSSRDRSPSRGKIITTKLTPHLHPVSPNSKLHTKREKETSPFAGIFRDQV